MLWSEMAALSIFFTFDLEMWHWPLTQPHGSCVLYMSHDGDHLCQVITNSYK